MSDFAVRLGGELIGVRVERAPGVVSWMRRTYAISAATASAVEICGRDVRRRGKLLRRARSTRELLAYAEWALTREALHRLCDRHVVLHAAWVGDALIVGRHGAGKSSLAIALRRMGWPVYSDDVVLLDGRGRVRPLERPLSVKGGTWPRLLPNPSRGSRRAPRALFVIDARRGGRARAVPLGQARALAEIARCEWNFGSRPAQGLSGTAALLGRARAWRVSGGSVADRCALIEGLA